MMSSFVGLFVILAGVILISVKILREDERLAIFRSGRFFKIVGPGLAFIIPIIDRGMKINISENIPCWRALSKIELQEKIKALALSKI
jgi:regulator of protease activity HflC (stomatin/prohibitin superfamily)